MASTRLANTAIICLSGNAGGMELDALKLAARLGRYGKVVLLAKQGGFIAGHFAEYCQHGSVTLETIGFRRMFSPAIIRGAKTVIEQFKIENVIFFGASELKSLFFAFLGKDINLLVRHGTTKSTPKKDLFHRIIYSRVAWHVAISKHLASNVQQIIPISPDSQIKIIYPTIIPAGIRQHRQQHSPIRILHIGRIANGKGQLDAVQACHVLHDKGLDFEMNLVGNFESPAYEAYFRSRLAELPYHNKINMTGFTRDIGTYLGNADIFLFPSHGEGFGNAFVEALGAGLVCIAYDNTTFPEFKDMGLHMELVADGDLECLGRILHETVCDLEQQLARSSSNIQMVQNLFSDAHEMNGYLEILRRQKPA